MKLRSILVVLSLLAFFSAVFGGYFYYSSLRGAFFDSAEQDAVAHVHTTNRFISQYIANYARIADVLSKLEATRRALETPERDMLNRANDILDQFKEGTQASVCYLMDQSGLTIASSNRLSEGSFVGKDYSFRPYFQEAMNGGSAAYLALGVTSGKRGVYFSHPVYGHDQNIPSGVAVVKGSAENIGMQLLRERSASHKVQNTMLFIVSPLGVIFFTDKKDFLFKTLWKTSLFEEQKIAEARQFGKGPWKWSGFRKLDNTHVTDGSGNRYSVYTENIANLPGWEIVHLSNVEAISSLVANPLLKTVGYLIIGLCALIGVAVLFLNNLAHSEIVRRRQAEQALRESEQRMKAILRTSPVGIGLVIDRKMDWANETMYRMVGYKEGALLGKSARIFYKNDEEYERVGRALYSGVTASGTGQVETRWARQDRTVFDCMLRACPLNPEDPSKGQIVVVNDISEAKRLEAQLQRAQKMEAIGTLAGGVAHDLNNILSGLVSYPELLLMQLPGDSPLKKPLEIIQKSGEKAAAVVQDLLTLARRGVSVKEVANLNEIITQYLESPEYEKLMSFHPGVEIKTRLEPEALNVSAVPFHLSKTVMNLVSNAAEALSGDGIIAVSTENRYIDQPIRGYEDVVAGDYVVLMVTDTGIGISEKDIKKIFEPFYTKKKMGRSGTGLGMAVVWNTVKDHHGYIDVHSREGEGTTFTLYFPATLEKQANNGSEPPIENYRGRGESILVVDDVEEQRIIATGMLKELGYSVTSVASGEEAVEHVKSHPVDLIVLDMIMDPGMDGLETYRKIIQSRPGQKCIIASGFSESDRIRETQRLGAGAYVKKPYLLNKIGPAVKAELNR